MKLRGSVSDRLSFEVNRQRFAMAGFSRGPGWRSELQVGGIDFG